MNSFYLQPDQDLPHTPSKIPQVPPTHLNVHLNEHTNSARFYSQSEKKRHFVYYNKGHHRKHTTLMNHKTWNFFTDCKFNSLTRRHQNSSHGRVHLKTTRAYFACQQLEPLCMQWINTALGMLYKRLFEWIKRTHIYFMDKKNLKIVLWSR